MDEKVYELDTEVLQPNPLQPRGLITPESLSELAESIREHGVLEPLVVAQTPAGFQIIAGERRWRAAKLVGLNKIPVIIKQTNPQGMLEMAIVENVQRVDLNPLERAQAYRRLMEEFNLANSEIAVRVGKSPAYISNTIRLLTLPDALKDALMSSATTEGHARALSSLEDPHLIIEAYKEVLKRNLSVRGTEELVRRIRAKKGIGPKRGADVSLMHVFSEEVDKMQEELSTILRNNIKDSHVKFYQTGKKTKVEFIINSEPSLANPLLQDIYNAVKGYFNLKVGV